MKEGQKETAILNLATLTQQIHIRGDYYRAVLSHCLKTNPPHDGRSEEMREDDGSWGGNGRRRSRQ
eukprot:761652-Hanusia_phi.AAC.1